MPLTRHRGPRLTETESVLGPGDQGLGAGGLLCGGDRASASQGEESPGLGDGGTRSACVSYRWAPGGQDGKVGVVCVLPQSVGFH